MSEQHTPIIILPGLLCDSRMFAHQLAAFPVSQVVDGFYGGADRLEDMADFALRHMPSAACVVGHSMGARVALEVVRQAPERVSRLMLANTGVHPVREGEQKHRYALRDLGRGMNMGALVDQWLPPMLSDAARNDMVLVQALRTMCIEAGLAHYEAQIEALLARPSVDDVLASLTCPTWVVTGDEDRWAPPAQHEAIAAQIANSTLRVISGAGHMLPAEQPTKFNLVLSEWMDVPKP